MIQSDYLMRMFLALATAMRQSLERSRGERDPQGAADLLEEAIVGATDMDGNLLLQMEPSTFGAMLSLETVDPALMEYLGRSLLLESHYLEEAGDFELAKLRHGQAHALAQTAGFELDEPMITAEELERFFERTQQR